MKHINLSTIIFSIIILGVCGCSMNHEAYEENAGIETIKDKEIVSSMESYFIEKYGSLSYNVVAFHKADWLYVYDSLTIEIERNERQYQVEIQRYVENDTYKFEDNYFGYLIKEEYEEYISSYAKKYFEDFFVEASTMSLNYPDSLDDNSTVADMLDFKDQITDQIVVVLVVNETFDSVEEFEKNAKEFCDVYGDVGLPTLWRIIYVDRKSYESVNQFDFREKGILTDNMAEYTE